MEKIAFSERDEVILLAFNQSTIPHGGMSSCRTKSYSVLRSVFTISAEHMNNFKLLYAATRDMLLAEPDKTITHNILQEFAYITLGIMDDWVHAKESEMPWNVPRAQRIVSDVMTDLQHYAIEQREVSFYAERASLSPKYFSRLIIKHTGKRPLDHIYGYLALETKCQLSSDRYTIKQIADNLNFPNTSDFFRTKTSLTPVGIHRIIVEIKCVSRYAVEVIVSAKFVIFGK